MSFFIDDDRPIFAQIAIRVENDIIEEILKEEDQVPSTNQFAAYYNINPATAAKGVNLLVDKGILYKKRGIGMFVAAGARSRLLEDRKKQFDEQYVKPMLQEAAKLGITSGQVIELIRKGERGQ
ncbi:GntR family transcriptional regulator [Paenibacillus senegalensis]|uniref:GntR family transcriptional regulator n=1 Tax=Paenibacillus senegalensis TaxID=1465766 RepID=UPI0002887A73|nr:GntR family transcriptional regulator [Paenibacillus senegalensis]